MKNIIYFKPALQTENTGDLLINKAALDLLRVHGEVIIDDSSTPGWFVDQISDVEKDSRLSSVSNGGSLQSTILKHLKEANKEKNQQIYLAIQPGHTSRKGIKSALRRVKDNIKFSALTANGCRIIRTGFSIGPFDKLNGIVESFHSKSYYYYAVRDQQSLKLAKKLNFKNPVYSPDLAWAHRPHVSDTMVKEDYVVLSFRSNAYGKEHDTAYLAPIKSELKEILQASIPTNIKIVIVYQVKYDREPAEELYADLIKIFPNTQFIDKKLLLDEAIDIYSKAKFVVSNRLHVLLLAFQSGTLSFPFVYDVDNRKITSIYLDNNLESMILYCNDAVDIQKQKITNILENEQGVLAKFNKLVSDNKQTIEKNLAEVFAS